MHRSDDEFGHCHCIVLSRFCHFWHTSFCPTSTGIPSPLPSDRIDARHLTIIILTLFNPVNEDFLPCLNRTLSLLHHTTQSPLSLAAAVTWAAWAGGKPGHISAFPGHACETTVLGRWQSNRIHFDFFFFVPTCVDCKRKNATILDQASRKASKRLHLRYQNTVETSVMPNWHTWQSQTKNVK